MTDILARHFTLSDSELARFEYLKVENIPEMMKSAIGITGPIAYSFILLFLTLSIIEEKGKVISENKIELGKIFFKAFIIIILLGTLYNEIFIAIVSLTELIGNVIMPENLLAKHKLMLIEGWKSTGGINILDISMMTLLSGIANALGAIIIYLFEIIRVLLLSLLYVIGPIALSCYLHNRLKSIAQGWFINYLQVSCWIIVMRTIQLVILNLQETMAKSSLFFMHSFIYSLIYVIAVIITPILTASIFSGRGLGFGAIGTVLLTGISYIMYKGALRTAKETGTVISGVPVEKRTQRISAIAGSMARNILDKASYTINRVKNLRENREKR